MAGPKPMASAICADAPRHERAAAVAAHVDLRRYSRRRVAYRRVWALEPEMVAARRLDQGSLGKLPALSGQAPIRLDALLAVDVDDEDARPRSGRDSKVGLGMGVEELVHLPHGPERVSRAKAAHGRLAAGFDRQDLEAQAPQSSKSR